MSFIKWGAASALALALGSDAFAQTQAQATAPASKATIAWAERGEQVEHSARNAVGSHQPLDLRCGQPVDMGKRCEEANRAEIQIGPGAMPFVHGCRDGISRPHVATIAPQLSRPIAATFADDSSEIGHPHLYQT